jgi:hypothetical protein
MKIKKCGKPHLNDSLLFAFVNPLSYDCRISFTLQQGSPSKDEIRLAACPQGCFSRRESFFCITFFSFL